MPSRIIRSPADMANLLTFLGDRKLPLTVSWENGKHRTADQNRLNRLWCSEVAEQTGDRTPEEVRGEAKLTFGVPILRAENPEFREKYDATIRPLPYETKLALMMEPFDFGVTRLMNVSQQVRYLDAMHRHYSTMGLELTQPDPQFRADAERYRVAA
jgi:hypothetical protein